MDHFFQELFIIEPQTGEVLNKKSYQPIWMLRLHRLSPSKKLYSEPQTVESWHWTNPHFSSNGKPETKPSLVYTAPYSSTPQAGVETSPVLSQGIVYIGASDGYLYAIDQATGIIKDKA